MTERRPATPATARLIAILYSPPTPPPSSVRELSRTATSFLTRLGDPADREVWHEFDQRYRPIIVAFAMRLGLGEADAADVAQESTLRFIDEYRAGRYDRDRGRLRTWLLGIVRTQSAMVKRKAQRRAALGGGDSVIIDCADESAVVAAWDEEREREILRRAMDELRTSSKTSAKTLQAFESLCIHAVPPAVVAEELGISVADTYLAKFRVAQRLRELAERIACEYPQ